MMLPIKIKLPEFFLNEEVRSGYTVTKEMKELWAVELDLLVQVQNICEKYSIKYYGYSGTMLGAVRHGGFIPWDDDIDIMMLRSDYNKFCYYAEKELVYPYFLQTEKTDSSSCFGLAKIRNTETTMILKSQMFRNFHYNQGISIDIFPLDCIPDSEEELFRFQRHLSKLKNNAYITRNRTHLDYDEKSWLKQFISFCWKTLKIPNLNFFKFEKECQKYNIINCKKIAAIFYKPNRTHGFMNLTSFNDSLLVDFEFLKIPLPYNYENMLYEMFGDWKRYDIGSTDHGDLIIDTKKSYKKFVPKYEIGITVGVFDLFHKGHLKLLKRCKERCKKLVVAICNDDYVLNVKHKSPVFSEVERAEIVSSLKCVDNVIIVTPEETEDKLLLLRKYPYNVLFSGDDWKGSLRYNKNEEDLAKEGVDVVYFPYTKDISTTEIKQKLSYKNEEKIGGEVFV